MKDKSMSNDKYLGETYYSVIIKDGSYKGWKAIYVGCGTMEFVKENENIIVKETVPNSPNWMQECWEKFKIEVKKQEMASL